jgi:hypothetical protein
MHYGQNLQRVIRYRRNPEKFKGRGWPPAFLSLSVPGIQIDERDQEF